MLLTLLWDHSPNIIDVLLDEQAADFFFFNFNKIYMNEKASRCRETATNSLDSYVNVLIAAIYVFFFFFNELGSGRNVTDLNTLVIPS